MRTVLVLMKREIIDHAAYFVAAAIASGLLIPLVTSLVLNDYHNGPPVPLAGLIPLGILVVVGLSALGVSQMYFDRTRRLSAFLLALPVSRGQIFTACVLTGVLVILTLIVPLALAGRILLNLKMTNFPFYGGLLSDLFWGISLACFTCYAVGLYAGCNVGSLTTLAILPVTMLVPLLIIAKGFGIELLALLLVLIVACLAGAWHKFSGSSL